MFGVNLSYNKYFTNFPTEKSIKTGLQHNTHQDLCFHEFIYFYNNLEIKMVLKRKSSKN